MPDLAQPLINEQATTVAAAQAAVGYAVPVPNVTAASSSNLTQVWMNSQGQVALVFDGGNLTIMMWPATYQDPMTEFQTFIKETSATAVIERVDRQPALVITPDTDAPHSNPAWVEVDRSGIDISIVSDTDGIHALLNVAGSLQ